MLTRRIRTLVAGAAAVGLVATLAVAPAAAQACAADSATLEEIAEGVELSLATSFTCTDATDAGSWSITVDVANESAIDVTIDEVELRHVTPSTHASADVSSTAEATGLPLNLAAGASGSFEASGDYVLAQVGNAALANVHLRLTGTVDEASFHVGLTVHLRGAGTDDEEAEVEAEGDAGSATAADVALERRAHGRPDWAPGVPSWLSAMLAEIFPDGFPWGGDTFPPAGMPEGDADADAAVSVSGGAALTGSDAAQAAEAGASVEVELPEEAVDVIPPWVTPGSPPEWVPGPPSFGAP